MATKSVSIQKQRYIDLLRDDRCRVLIAQGVAGSGKTSLAVKEGLLKLEKSNRYDRLIFTKPIMPIEKSENIGFLPGSEEDKLSVYFEHITEMLKDHLPKQKLKTYIKDEIIQFTLCGNLRGKNYKRCYLVGDEMQNSTTKIMKAFLTRIGEGSKMVITGDMDQKDIQGVSGLEDFLGCMDILPPNDKIQKVVLNHQDIVRDPIVKDILDIYNGYIAP